MIGTTNRFAAVNVGDHQFFAKIVYGQTIHVHKMIGLCAH